jgi:hypothetical protein
MNYTLLNPVPRDSVQQTLVIHMGYIPEKSCESENAVHEFNTVSEKWG